MGQLTIQQAFEQALRHHQSGRLQEAEQLYRQILDQQPAHVGALHYSGVLAHQRGQHAIAVDLIRKSIAINPNVPEAHNNLGLALKAAGQVDQAIAAYERALQLKPRYANAFYNLGNVLKEQEKLDEAIAAYRQAIAYDPALFDAHLHLGNALDENERLEEAIVAYRAAAALRGDHAGAHYRFAKALLRAGEIPQALAAFRATIPLLPDSADCYCNFGYALYLDGQLELAIAALRKAIALQPDFAEAYNNLGNLLRGTSEIEEACGTFQKAIVLKPEYAGAYSNLGTALQDMGQLDDAIAAFRRAVALDSAGYEAHCNLIYALYYHQDYDTSSIARELLRWRKQHCAQFQEDITSYSNDRSPGRRLRIGYVSPDLCTHAVGKNLLPFFAHHDCTQQEIVCYSDVACHDATTGILRQHASLWRDTFGWPDQKLATQIREDRIDILVDLALHTGNNRLRVFARKPAPLQVTYLAYCGSSGLNTMDYRLSDPYIDPEGTDLSVYAEQTIRLPRTYWCYEPPPADQAPPPVLRNGFVTFGCLNNFAKVSPAAVALWSKILVAVPGSRMTLQAPLGKPRDDVMRSFQSVGVRGDRLLFVGRQSYEHYLTRYSQIDIALDPFPYGGGITTLDALWMGVPVITLSGATAVGRGGQSILSNLGLSELIALDPGQYKRIAVELASDRDRMLTLRSGLRARMLASPLLDAVGFARDVEAAYRMMWRKWCATAASVNER
jgi:protein O-GlcNAc transferase